jgi:acyl carrier protein
VTNGTEEDGRPGPAVDTFETLAALRDLPEVRDALVAEQPGPDGAPVILGYVTGPDPALGVAWIRQYLVARLPGHLVPASLFVLEEFPLTAAGEYDLSAFPQPEADDSRAESYLAPRTPMEQQLAGILAELLNVDRVGIHDSFFERGGFSLLATQLTSRIRETYYVDLSLRDVFTAPTVDQLAQLIVRAQGELLGDDDLDALLDEIGS